MLKKYNYNTIDIDCIKRAVSFNEKMFKDILASTDPVEKFSKLITDIQNLDVYSAKQNFFENKDGSITCTYTLTETLPAILPFTPLVEPENQDMVIDEEVFLWAVNLVGINGDPEDKSSYKNLGQIEYKEFINRLPKEKYSFIDARYILVQPLNNKELRQILGFE